MISRRKLLKLVSGVPGFMLGLWASTSKTSGLVTTGKFPKPNNLYQSLGVRPLINARGTVTVLGACRMLPEVQQAMEEASKEYVQLDELMEGVGKRLGELTGTEWGIVTSGASGAITAGTAGCIAGGDPDKIWQLPDLTGMKDEVIIPSYSRSAYDAAARAVGAKMVEVDNAEQLKAALGPRTAMIMVLAGGRSENGPLSLREIAALAKPMSVPILVDAAAEGLPVPNPHIAQGADLVAYSGGKYLQGPQCSGLLLGRKDLVQASWISVAPHHGFGRGYKVGREEIMGALAAVEVWMKRDHTRIMKLWNSRLEFISWRLAGIPGVYTEIRQPRGRSNPSPNLAVQWDPNLIPYTGQEVEQLLWNGNPRIAVSGAGSYLPFPPNLNPTISINSSQLEDGEEAAIADRVYEILQNPRPRAVKKDSPVANIAGQWDVEMKFSASSVNQRFDIEQSGSDLLGRHHASFADRKLSGSVQGKDVLLRSSYTGQGVRLNFEFTGTVSDNTMRGEVSMGEYGLAEWQAKRRIS